MSAQPTRYGIIKPCCIGDAVMSLPVIDNLLQNVPDVEIEVWCGAHARPVYEICHGVDRIVEIPSVPGLRDLPALAWGLRASDCDSFIVLDRSRLIDAACKLARVDVAGTVRGGPADGVHETDSYLGALTRAGLRLSTMAPSITFDQDAVARAQAEIHLANDCYVVLHPGGAENPGANMHSKRWPAEHWTAVVQWLSERDIQPVLTGSPAEVELCQSVASGTGAVVAAGKLSLIESAALASSAAAYAGPDTGLSHLAAAAGASVVVIFGPTNPRQYAPRGPRVTVLAASGAENLARTDLRHQQSSDLPATSSVGIDVMIAALESALAAGGQP